MGEGARMEVRHNQVRYRSELYAHLTSASTPHLWLCRTVFHVTPHLGTQSLHQGAGVASVRGAGTMAATGRSAGSAASAAIASHRARATTGCAAWSSGATRTTPSRWRSARRKRRWWGTAPPPRAPRAPRRAPPAPRCAPTPPARRALRQDRGIGRVGANFRENYSFT